MARPKKIVRFKIQPFRNATGSESWRVTGTMPDGRRIRQNYGKRIEAVQRVADLELEVAGHPEPRKARRTLLTSEQLADAEAAIKQLGEAPFAKAVAHYQSLQARAEAKGVSLDQAFSFFESRYRPEIQAISILNAKAEFLGSRTNIVDATRANYETGLSLLVKLGPNRHVHSFTVQDLEQALGKYTNLRSQRSFRRIFSVFFGWAVRHHYCLENPCLRLDKLTREISQISILSLSEVKRLLYAAVAYQDGATAPAIAIGLFAGLRPSEIEDLKPEDIGETHIRVTGGKLRRQLNRSVPIPPVLASWLKRLPFKGLPEGWDYKFKQLKKATKAAKWVSDIIRHTSISFQSERDKNEALTAYNNGTSTKMMDLYYRNNVGSQAALDEFWSLTPEALLASPPPVELPVRLQINWPSKASLKKLVWSKPLTHAAGELGVSDVALRKRCMKLGIELPAHGYWLRRESGQHS